MKRVLVTGSAGFIGRHMVAELERRGWTVLGLDPAAETPMDCLGLFRYDDTVAFDLVVHAAAVGAHRAAIDGQPATTTRNALLDAAMFDWAVRTGQRRVLYLSSSAVYPAWLQASYADAAEPAVVLREADCDSADPEGPPHDAYGWNKLAGERLAAAACAAGVPVHIVRPFSGYGEDQAEDFPFGAFVARARRREDPFTVWGDGSQVRDWIHVDDVVAGALAVVDADVREPVNLCTGEGMSMTDLARMVCKAAGYEPEFEFDTRRPAGVAYRVGEPTRMRAVFTPRVSLGEGAARAFAKASA